MSQPKEDFEECRVEYTAIGKANQWETSCPCGFWTKGTKRECEARANGHPARKVTQ
jgi:hypothetical protein